MRAILSNNKALEKAKRMFRAANIYLASALVIVATVLPAIYEGNRNFRWGHDAKLDEYIQRMKAFPNQIGQWTQSDRLMMDADSRNMLKPFATINRVYSNGERLASVFVLLGPTGPAAVHTPDICFSARDYKALGSRIAVNGENGRSHFWQIDFKSTGIEGNALRNWYAWTSDGRWHASRDPRYEFADQRFLFKVQVAIAYPSVEDLRADTDSAKFLLELEKALNEFVFTRTSAN